MDSIQQSVGKNIAHYRHKRGFSQEKLAVRSGLSAEYICRVETGKKDAKLTTLQKIAKALEIDMYLLLK